MNTKKKEILRIVNLGLKVDSKTVLQNVNLYIQEGETFALFGPNGSGKSSLLSAIVGNPVYKITSGRIIFKGQDITSMTADERVKLGMGIAFQTPPKVSGVKLIDVLRHCARIGGRSEEDIYRYAEMLKMDEFLERSINYGFSGGEVKRSELLQLILMNRDFLMLDEPDSGVDLENIDLIGKTIRELLERDKKEDERKKSGLLITHTGKILDYVDADYGVILYKGRVACVGNPYDILREVSKNGYEGCINKCLREFPNLNSN
ncbi:Iron-regulated ABC transporter ATPase subunit SufC [Archaeoglobus sulfaticallidus PM70-1]|uniref:Iron-regulated ABC transporter ATPase subunit SufC n=1 Tax=Archaeoglobus sulfaticallidus PM70-1 TaxID=387631 RepID=N0BLJ4_9EURY|nr:ABC transporter ATP-binding protein [Archaeoglobus sulfaticallidus]AGK61411.1 Iron-regulated ABC transporter ATPase subunit SufC [Archaeoglobus sulfaticallidus PM70-1]